MTLNDIWFILFVVIIAGYLILDGFDLGVGILHMLVAEQHRSHLGWQRSMAGYRRRRPFRRLSPSLRFLVLWFLPGHDAGPARSDTARRGNRISK